MTRDDQDERGKGTMPTARGRRPYIVYRNPKDTSIKKVFNPVEKERRAKMLPVIQNGREPRKPLLLRD